MSPYDYRVEIRDPHGTEIRVLLSGVGEFIPRVENRPPNDIDLSRSEDISIALSHFDQTYFELLDSSNIYDITIRTPYQDRRFFGYLLLHRKLSADLLIQSHVTISPIRFRPIDQSIPYSEVIYDDIEEDSYEPKIITIE